MVDAATARVLRASFSEGCFQEITGNILVDIDVKTHLPVFSSYYVYSSSSVVVYNPEKLHTHTCGAPDVHHIPPRKRVYTAVVVVLIVVANDLHMLFFRATIQQ